MRLVVAAAALLAAAAPGWAQQASQEQLKANLDKKLKSAFLAKATWLTDYDKALEESRKSGKPIFAYFTTSYFR
jgi:hypothetical protein